jgi:hypothetical protein
MKQARDSKGRFKPGPKKPAPTIKLRKVPDDPAYRQLDEAIKRAKDGDTETKLLKA